MVRTYVYIINMAFNGRTIVNEQKITITDDKDILYSTLRYNYNWVLMILKKIQIIQSDDFL